MDLKDNITKHIKPLSLTAIAAAATAVSILGYRSCHSSKKTVAGEYREIPLAKGWIPYFGNFGTLLLHTRTHPHRFYRTFMDIRIQWRHCGHGNGTKKC